MCTLFALATAADDQAIQEELVFDAIQAVVLLLEDYVRGYEIDTAMAAVDLAEAEEVEEVAEVWAYNKNSFVANDKDEAGAEDGNGLLGQGLSLNVPDELLEIHTIGHGKTDIAAALAPDDDDVGKDASKIVTDLFCLPFLAVKEEREGEDKANSRFTRYYPVEK